MSAKVMKKLYVKKILFLFVDNIVLFQKRRMSPKCLLFRATDRSKFSIVSIGGKYLTLVPIFSTNATSRKGLREHNCNQHYNFNV